MRWRTKDGRYTVEVITLTLTGRRRDGGWIRLREWGFFAAEVRTPEELADLIDLADLVEALPATA